MFPSLNSSVIWVKQWCFEELHMWPARCLQQCMLCSGDTVIKPPFTRHSHVVFWVSYAYTQPTKHTSQHTLIILKTGVLISGDNCHTLEGQDTNQILKNSEFSKSGYLLNPKRASQTYIQKNYLSTLTHSHTNTILKSQTEIIPDVST